jgi:hypothetical protein
MQQDRAGWRPRLVVALLPGALLLAANADPTPTPSIADRYAGADRYLRPELDKLIINADLRATFTRDGTGILYRLGSAGKRQIL